MRKASMLVAVLAIATMVAGATTAERWIHIRVEDHSGNGEKVKVNLPLSLLEKVAGAIDFEEIDGAHFRGGKIQIDDEDFDHIDLRAMWEAVKDTDDMEFVSVESSDQNVRVAKDSGYLLVQVRSGKREDDEESGKGEKVDVKVPLAVVDALLSAGEKELDLRAALRALAEHGEGELVVVEDGSSSVRIWIDDRNSSE